MKKLSFLLSVILILSSLLVSCSDGGDIDGLACDCIISRNVTIQKGAVVKNSILLHNCVIEEGAVVENVVLDRSVRVTKGRKLIGTSSYPLAISEETVI